MDDRRINGPGTQSDEEPEADTQDGEGPALSADVVDEQDGGGQRDQDEQLEGRKAGMDVGVAGPLDVAVVREVEVETCQEVADRLDQGHETQQDGDVRLDRRQHPRPGALEADAAVQVVAERGDDEYDHERNQCPVHQELLEGQDEDVVADVPVELRVGGVERGAVPEEQPVLPLADCSRTHDKGETGDHEHPEPPRRGR